MKEKMNILKYLPQEALDLIELEEIINKCLFDKILEYNFCKTQRDAKQVAFACARPIAEKIYEENYRKQFKQMRDKENEML